MEINVPFIITPEYRRKNQKHLFGSIIVSDIRVTAGTFTIPVKIIQYTHGDRAGEYDLIFQNYRYNPEHPYDVKGRVVGWMQDSDRRLCEDDDGKRLCRMDPHYLVMEKSSPEYEYLIIRSLDGESYNVIANSDKGWVAIDRIVQFWTFWSRLRTFMWGSHG